MAVSERRLSEHADVTACRAQKSQDDMDARGLAGAIRAQQTDDLAGIEFEGKALQRRGISVHFTEVLRLDQRLHDHDYNKLRPFNLLLH